MVGRWLCLGQSPTAAKDQWPPPNFAVLRLANFNHHWPTPSPGRRLSQRSVCQPVACHCPASRQQHYLRHYNWLHSWEFPWLSRSTSQAPCSRSSLDQRTTNLDITRLCRWTPNLAQLFTESRLESCSQRRSPQHCWSQQHKRTTKWLTPSFQPGALVLPSTPHHPITQRMDLGLSSTPLSRIAPPDHDQVGPFLSKSNKWESD